MYNRTYNMFYLIAAVLFLNSTITFAAVEPNLSDILDQASEHLNSISSIRYSSSIETIETIKTKEGQGNSLKVEQIDQIFIYDRGKYRASVASPDPAEYQFQREFAFNGYIYQELNPYQSSLNITRKRSLVPYGIMEIITTSYLFAIQPGPNSEFSLETLRKDTVWQNVKSIARYHSQQEIMGHQCVVLRIPYSVVPPGATKRELVQVVAFAEDLNWFPVRFESEVDGIIASRWELTKYVVNRVGDSKFVMPLSLKGIAFNSDGEIWKSTTLVVKPESVEINKPIPEEIFTIDFSLAETVWDNDAQVFLKQKRE